MESSAPYLNVKKLKITDHAIKRAKERLNRSGRTRTDILNLCKSIIGNSNTIYLGISPCEDGNICHMYVNKGNAFYVNLDLEVIVTIINHESKVGNIKHFIGLEDKIKKIYEYELRTIEQMEKINLTKQELIKSKKYIFENPQIRLNMYCAQLSEIRSAKNSIMKAMASTVYG